MPDLNAWLGVSSSDWTPTAAERAALAWTRINEKATSIVIRRNGVNLAAQTVRVEASNYVNEQYGANVLAGMGRIVVFGVRGHATVTDTDMQAGDRFVTGGMEYEITLVTGTLGEVQGVGERRR